MTQAPIPEDEDEREQKPISSPKKINRDLKD